MKEKWDRDKSRLGALSDHSAGPTPGEETRKKEPQAAL